MKISDYIALKIKKIRFKDIPVFQGGAIMHIKVSKDYNVIDHTKKYLNSIYKF